MRATTSSISLGADVDDRRSAAPRRSCGGARAWRSRIARARFVEHVDGAVGQLVVAQVPRRQLGRRLERVVGELARGGAPRSASAGPGGSCTVSGIDGSSMVIFCSRRASARSFSMCLNSSCVVEPTTRSWPAVRIGLISVARSIVPPVVAPAPTVEWISSMKRIGIGRFGERVDDRLEPLLEVAAEPRAGEQRRRCRARRPRRPSSSSGTSSPSSRVASPSASAVLPTPASPTNTGLFLRRRQRISIVRCELVACGRSADRARRRARGRSGSWRTRRADRATSPCRARRRRPRRRPALARRRRRAPAGGTLLMPCVMYSSTSSRVTPCAASSCAAYDLFCCSVAASTSPDCTSCRPALCTCSTAVCSTRRNASVCSGSFCWPRAELLDRLLQVLVEILAQLRQVGAAGGEDPLAVRIVRERVEQVLERQVGMPPRGRLAVGDGQHDFESWTEHCLC